MGGFSRGMHVALLETIPASICGWVLYDIIYDAVSQSDRERVFTPSAVAAVGAACASSVIAYPLITLRRNMQMINHAGALELARNTWRTLGAGGFYRGFAPHLLQVVPQNAMAWYLFELWRRSLQSAY